MLGIHMLGIHMLVCTFFNSPPTLRSCDIRRVPRDIRVSGADAHINREGGVAVQRLRVEKTWLHVYHPRL